MSAGIPEVLFYLGSGEKYSKIIKTFYRKQTQKGRRSANFLLY